MYSKTTFLGHDKAAYVLTDGIDYGYSGFYPCEFKSDAALTTLPRRGYPDVVISQIIPLLLKDRYNFKRTCCYNATQRARENGSPISSTITGSRV